MIFKFVLPDANVNKSKLLALLLYLLVLASRPLGEMIGKLIILPKALSKRANPLHLHNGSTSDGVYLEKSSSFLAEEGLKAHLVTQTLSSLKLTD